MKGGSFGKVYVNFQSQMPLAIIPLALDMNLIQLLMAECKCGGRTGCPLEKDILGGRQSNGNKDLM